MANKNDNDKVKRNEWTKPGVIYQRATHGELTRTSGDIIIPWALNKIKDLFNNPDFKFVEILNPVKYIQDSSGVFLPEPKNIHVYSDNVPYRVSSIVLAHRLDIEDQSLDLDTWNESQGLDTLEKRNGAKRQMEKENSNVPTDYCPIVVETDFLSGGIRGYLYDVPRNLKNATDSRDNSRILAKYLENKAKDFILLDNPEGSCLDKLLGSEKQIIENWQRPSRIILNVSTLGSYGIQKE